MTNPFSYHNFIKKISQRICLVIITKVGFKLTKLCDELFVGHIDGEMQIRVLPLLQQNVLIATTARVCILGSQEDSLITDLRNTRKMMLIDTKIRRYFSMFTIMGTLSNQDLNHKKKG